MLKNYLTDKATEVLLSEKDTLAVLRCAPEQQPDTGCAAISLQLDSLDGSSPTSVEVWKTNDGPVTSGQYKDCAWRRSEQFQMVSITVDCKDGDDFEAATLAAYSSVLETIQLSNHPKLIRFWNLIPFINHGEGKLENYKTFCNGRLRAFEQFGLKDQQFPAASCVGHYRQGIVVYALSSTFDATHIANPRQVNAYSYPEQYGPSSPSFARATSVSAGESELCFISGTASILGHNTVHQDDLVGQLHTTNDNILYLLKEAGRTTDEVRSLRVYIRRPEDFDTVKEMVDHWYPGRTVNYTHADICRSDLLVEIECFCAAQGLS